MLQKHKKERDHQHIQRIIPNSLKKKKRNKEEKERKSRTPGPTNVEREKKNRRQKKIEQKNQPVSLTQTSKVSVRTGKKSSNHPAIGFSSISSSLPCDNTIINHQSANRM
jgi:hypothetical protein